MNLEHRRMFNGRPFVSVTHYGYRDPLANELADTIRKETKARVRVVTDRTGFTHVFVETCAEMRAGRIAERREFS